jgi:AraC family transcriptional regulator of adaptative response/methylated-DNA-[protein]-cysteine methyltransferase
MPMIFRRSFDSEISIGSNIRVENPPQLSYCHSMSENEHIANYRRIEKAIGFVEAHFKEQPSLDDIAASAGLSKFHFLRLFKDFAGITPTQFLHYLTVEYAKSRLAEAQSVFNSALDAGLSGGGRLQDMFINIEAMSPGEYKDLGEGVEIQYGMHCTPFGEAFIATTRRGICSLRFMTTKKEADLAVRELKSKWPKAVFSLDEQATRKFARQIFNRKSKTKKLTLLVKGTNFQIKVWQALLTIPEGSLVSYEDLAASIGKPTATRAVASSVARNEISYLIPCHRVISKAGKIHQYRWGRVRKQIIIGFEAARSGNESQ